LSDEALANGLEHATSVLTNRDSRAHSQFLTTILRMIENLLEKNVTSAAVNAELASRLGFHLSSLQNMTINCESPEIFLAALRCWHVTAERLADAATGSDSQRAEAAKSAASQLKDGLMNLAQQCLQKALYAHNGAVLENLEYWSDDEDESHWGDGQLLEEGEMNAYANDTESLPERTRYITKCLQVISELDRLFPASVRPAAISFALETISNGSGNVDDKLVALQLLADCASSESTHEVVATLIERIAAHCLVNDSLKLRRAAYHTIGSLVIALDHSVELARKIAELAARDSVLQGANCKRLSVAAASFLCELTSKVRTPIFNAEPVSGSAVREVSTAKGASLLALSAFHVWLMPPKGSSTAGGNISEVEWHERSKAFKSFLQAALHDFEVVCENTTAQYDEDTLCCIVDRASLILHSIFTNARGELSGTRDGAWASCSSYVVASVNAIRRTGLGGDGRPVAMLLHMLAVAFATCRRFVEGLPQNILQYTLQLVSSAPEGPSRDKVLNALFYLLKSELKEVIPGSTDTMIASAVDLCSRYTLKGNNTETKIIALQILEEAFSRHWRFFFPSDTSEAFLNGGRTQVADDGSQFNIAMQGVFSALSSEEPEVFSAALSCLEKANASRRLFSRQAFINGQAGMNTLGAVFSSLVSRTQPAYQDRLVAILYDICIPNASVFYEVLLPRLLQAQGFLTENQQHELLSNFGQPGDAPSFQQAAEALANDIAYFAQKHR